MAAMNEPRRESTYARGAVEGQNAMTPELRLRVVRGSAPLRPDRREQCQQRERLLREWTECSNRLMTLQGEEFAAMRTGGSISASFVEKIRVAKAADIEACRTYHQHVNMHGCV